MLRTHEHQPWADAWAAGVFDGEGCVHIARVAPRTDQQRVRFALRLKVSMAHEATVRRIHALFGLGSFHEQHRAGYRDCWTWVVQSRQAGVVVERLLPYSITKHSELLIARAFLATPRGKDGADDRAALDQAMRHAKRAVAA